VKAMEMRRFRLSIACVLVICVFLVGGRLFLDSKYVVPVLMYHSVDEKAAQTKLSVLPESFERQMKFLRDSNYNVVTLEKLIEGMDSGKPHPPRTVAITFDDGYENNYTNAFAAIKKYRIPATIFVVVNNIGREGYLNRAQIKEMSASGLVSVDSHTMSHSYLPSVSDKRQLKKEIFTSKTALQSITGKKKMSFSYPQGGFNEEIRAMVREAGYYGACATNPGGGYPGDDIYAIKRVRISRTSDNMFVFWIEASGYYTFIKEIRDED